MIEDDNSLSINMIAREVGIDWKTVLLILRKSCTAEESKQPNGCFSLRWTQYITA